MQPAAFRYGNAGRNILEGPGLRSFDLGLIKNTSIREGHVIQFRAEFFNAWNNVNFGLPDSNIASGAYGTISSAGLSREIQFGLKYLSDGGQPVGGSNLINPELCPDQGSLSPVRLS